MNSEAESLVRESLALFQHIGKDWRDRADPLLFHLMPVILIGCIQATLHVRVMHAQRETLDVILDELARRPWSDREDNTLGGRHTG
jgi:hypothetical protein